MKPTTGQINDLPVPSEGETNVKNRQKLATIPGSCAFDSAAIALLPITDAAHIVHGPSGCAISIWGSLNNCLASPHLHKTRFTSEIEESNIIFGGAKKLHKGILELQRRYKPNAIFVYSTCITAMIGDDIEGVCRDVTLETGIPAIPVHCPGFIGTQNLGVKVASQALLEHVIGTAEPDISTPFDINLIGEYPIADALANILPRLEQLGIRVLAKITGNSRFQELRYAHRAKLNVVLASKAMTSMAKQMQKKFSIPFIEESIYGVENTDRCLRNIAVSLGNVELQQRVEQLINNEKTNLEAKLTIYRHKLQEKRIILDIANFKSWLIVHLSSQLGLEIIPIATNYLKKDDHKQIQDLLNCEIIIIQQQKTAEIQTEIQQLINQYRADMLICDRQYAYAAIATNIAFLNVNTELTRSYGGYIGALEITQELYAAISSSIWEQLHQPNPWDEEV